MQASRPDETNTGSELCEAVGIEPESEGHQFSQMANGHAGSFSADPAGFGLVGIEVDVRDRARTDHKIGPRLNGVRQNGGRHGQGLSLIHI